MARISLIRLYCVRDGGNPRIRRARARQRGVRPRRGGASRKRLLQVGDRTGHAITAALRDAVEAGTVTLFPKSPLAELGRGENGWRARVGEHTLDAATVILAAGGRCYAVAEERGELSTNHPGATGEVTRIALAAGAEARDPDPLP